MVVKDYFRSIQSYDKALFSLSTDERLPAKNRKLAISWIKQKDKSLEDADKGANLSLEEIKENRHRRCKTLYKYVQMLKNVCYWFPDLSNTSLKDLKAFRKDFYDDKIKSIAGKPIKSKRDYIVKVFRSDFFKNYLGLESEIKQVFNDKVKKVKNSVEFITPEDLQTLIESCRYNDHKVILYTLFNSGVRIGTLLNLKVQDFERKYNNKTKVFYFICHIRKEYTKSNDDRSVPILMPDANVQLEKYFKTLNPKDFIVNMTYTGVRQFLERLVSETHIKTKPNEGKLHAHVFRSSCALHLLNQGFSSDQVKGFLGHSPSSDAIDCYVNYSGSKFEVETSRVQTDELVSLHKTIQDQERRLTNMQQQVDQISELVQKQFKAQKVRNKIKK